MSRTSKYIMAIVIVVLIYLAGYFCHSLFMKHDDIGLGWLFIYSIEAGLGFIGSVISIGFSRSNSSLAYLSICFLNLSFLLALSLKGVITIAIMPVIMGIIMLFLHIKSFKKGQ